MRCWRILLSLNAAAARTMLRGFPIELWNMVISPEAERVLSAPSLERSSWFESKVLRLPNSNSLSRQGPSACKRESPTSEVSVGAGSRAAGVKVRQEMMMATFLAPAVLSSRSRP